MNAGTTDTALIDRILQGEHGCYAELVNRYRDFVFALVLRYIPVREDAEEIAQDVFVKAFRSLPGFRGESRFSTWLYTIAHTSCLSYLRKKSPVTRSLDYSDVLAEADSRYAQSGVHLADQQSNAAMLNKAIALLQADDARLIVLFYTAGQTLEEIGLILGINPNTVKVRLHRARGRLKEKLEQYFVQDIKN